MSATPGGASANSPPVCQNCSTSTTPLWRRDESGSVLCNACGLFLKLHGRARPISLKTDVIKSRNRAKVQAGGVRKKSSGEPQPSLTATHPETASLDPSLRKLSTPTHLLPPPSRSHSPISRIGTPLSHSNIAPQHMFDSVVHAPSPSALNGGVIPPFARTASPNLPIPYPPSFRGLSPSVASSVNGSAFLNADLPNPMGQESLTVLKTRVSELEVINDLFRGRVAELEASEAAARESEARMRAELEQFGMREQMMKRRLDDLEARLNGGAGVLMAGNAAGSPVDQSPLANLENPRKRVKMSLGDLVDADGSLPSRSGTPLSMASSS